MNTVLFGIGTRPEAIKLAAVIMTMRRVCADLEPIVALAGRHSEMAREALGVFDLAADIQLDVPHGESDPCVMAARMTEAIAGLIDQCAPHAVVVQGDTVAAFASGFAAALRRVPVAHVEAGLRTGCLNDPFPEELARRQLAQLAHWNFAPTREAEMNLLHEGVAPERIDLVGNTVVDALRLVGDRLAFSGPLVSGSVGQPWTILVTAQRWENWGAGLERVCRGLRRLAARYADLRIVFSVHPNPAVREVVHAHLGGLASVVLIDPSPYDAWVRRLVECDAILTDSGGLVEEGCVLGKPVLVMREATERPEALRAGSAMMVGTDPDRIVEAVRMLMTDREAYACMARSQDVFGDGFASERIVARMSADLRRDGVVDTESGLRGAMGCVGCGE